MRPLIFRYAQLTLYVLTVVSCVTEFQSDPVSVPAALIVEGLITNQPGPYTVKLTRTADYSYKSLNLLEIGATVTISDNLGNQETLTEKLPGGTYQTSATGLRGIVGRTYKVAIKTRNGDQYESQSEVLKAAPAIDRVYSEYRYDSQASDNGKANGWDVYIDTKDPATAGDFYRWEWAHYEAADACKSVYVPGDYVRLGYRCCSKCWDITRCYTNCINVMSDANINGNSISRQFIERVPFDSETQYYIEVTQQSISRVFMNSLKPPGNRCKIRGGYSMRHRVV